MIPLWLLEKNTWKAIGVVVLIGLVIAWWNAQKAAWYQSGYDARIAEEADARAKQDNIDIIALELVNEQVQQELDKAQDLIQKLKGRKPEVITRVITEYVESDSGCVDFGDGYIGLWHEIHGIKQSGN